MSYRTHAVAQNGEGSTTLTITVPASTQVGDVVLVGFQWFGSPTVSSLVSSTGRAITEVQPVHNSGNGSSALYGFTAASGDAGSTITLTVSGATRIAGIAYVESNCGGVETSGRTTSGTGTTITVPAVTPGGANRRQVSFYGGSDTNSGVTNSLGDLSFNSVPYTKRAAVRSTSASVRNANLAVADRTLATANPTGQATSTAALSLSYGSGMTALLIPSNGSPTASAGADQAVAPGATVTLDGTASTDPEAAPLTYTWTQTAGAPVELSSTTIAQPTFTAPTSVNDQTLTFRLVVTDGVGQESAPDTVTVAVAPAAFMYRREGGAWVRRKLYRRVGGAWVWP